MPTYQYVCTECGGQLEAVQKFTDDPLTVHDDCGGRLRKVFSPVGIVFKGSGFYRTDSRKGSTASEPASSSARVLGRLSSSSSVAARSPGAATSPSASSSGDKSTAPARLRLRPSSSSASKSSAEKVA